MQTKVGSISELLDKVEMPQTERARLKMTADRIEFFCDYVYSKVLVVSAFCKNLRSRIAAADFKQGTT